MRQRTSTLPLATPDADDELIGLVDGVDSRVPLSSLATASPPTASQVPADTAGHNVLTGTDVQAQLDEADGLLTAVSDPNTVVNVHRAEPSAHDAVQIDYDNAASGLTAVDVQAAVDEVDALADQAITDSAAATATADQAASDAAAAAADAATAQATADGAVNDLASKVDTAGDTMTGPLVLVGDPVADLEAATKKYVDDTATGGGGLVNSINGQSGVVVLDADDIDDSATTNRWVEIYADEASLPAVDTPDIGRVAFALLERRWFSVEDVGLGTIGWQRNFFNYQFVTISGATPSADPGTGPRLLVRDHPTDGGMFFWSTTDTAWKKAGSVVSAQNAQTQIWRGTQAQFDAIGTKDANTLYFVTA